ncbi:hypothetical protein STAS_23435 [Striga asiatica]|uniref:Uncharacterized protein n=1 Tax=Striga asiatica TaxID=4170 RepID=A0A5A7QN27_STRAF|nr:hypothetical protein STAS_23435 [Striga asiatica]
MAARSRNEDASDLLEAAEEDEVLKLEVEVQQMAQKIFEYRAILPDQFSSTLRSVLASGKPVFTTRLADERTEPATPVLPRPDSEAGISRGLMRENTDLPATEDKEEDDKIQLLQQKISSNTVFLPALLNRMKEYMARIDKLESSDLIIHAAFKRKSTG